MTQTYTALVSRGRATWTAEVMGLPNGKTCLAMDKDWKKVGALAAEATEVSLGLPSGSVKIELELKDTELQTLVEKTKAARVAAKKAQAESNEALRKAAFVLTAITTNRDVAAMLDCSYQYISKIAPKDRKGEEPGSTPEDWAKMLYLVANMRTVVPVGQLAQEAKYWLSSFPDDPGFAAEVHKEHQKLIQDSRK